MPLELLFLVTSPDTSEFWLKRTEEKEHQQTLLSCFHLAPRLLGATKCQNDMPRQIVWLRSVYVPHACKVVSATVYSYPFAKRPNDAVPQSESCAFVAAGVGKL